MVYMYHSFLIHSSADGHLGCFHVLAIINSAVMNIGVYVSLSDLVSQKWDCWVICGSSTPVFLPGEFHGQRSLTGYSPWGHKESDMTEQLTHTPSSFLFIFGCSWSLFQHMSTSLLRGLLSSCGEWWLLLL